jgi:predicted TIM-barrel fold metal-dependent hydrolase
MSANPVSPSTLEHNVTGIDLADQSRFRYTGPPLVDVHTHVMLTWPGQMPGNQGNAPPVAERSIHQAETMLQIASQFGVGRLYSMCPADDIPRLRERFGDRLRFNGSIAKSRPDEPDDDVYRRLERFLELNIEIVKFWAAPRGRDRCLVVDAPWRIEAARRARAAGVRVIMVHVSDPDRWFQTVYADAAKFGTKADQYVGLRHMLEEFPDLTWIAAHMGGDVEHPDHLAALLERYPNLYLDTSATKWQVREVSPRRDEVRAVVCRYPERFLFGSDLVTRHGLPPEHYASRYWCQRMLWESDWEGESPIADPDYVAAPGGPPTPLLRGVHLPPEVLGLVYQGNAHRLLDPR